MLNMDLPHSRRAPNTSLLITINALDLLIQIAPFMGTAICARLKVTLLPTALNWRWLESSEESITVSKLEPKPRLRRRLNLTITQHQRLNLLPGHNHHPRPLARSPMQRRAMATMPMSSLILVPLLSLFLTLNLKRK